MTASVLTTSQHRGLALARRLDAGIVHVNDQPVNDEPLIGIARPLEFAFVVA